MANNISYHITPAEIVEKKLMFRIPLYQRLFAWRSREVHQLMDDLLNHFCGYRLMETTPSRTMDTLYVKDDVKNYYIGMITVVRQGGRLDLIDGQQRTTVLMLLAIGFLQTLPEGNSRDNWIKLFDSSNRVFFNGRSQDRDFLKALSEDKVKTTGYRNIHMEEALELIKKFLYENFNNDILESFADAVYNNLTIFVTELSEDYIKNPTSLNEYFEAMNSSGKSLEQHEILKVELLRNYGKTDKLNLTRLWNAVSNFEKTLVKLEDIEDATRHQREQYRHFISLCRNGKIEDACGDFYHQSKNEGTESSIAEIVVEKHDFSSKISRDKEDSIISFPQFLLLVLALYKGNDDLAKVHPSKLHDTFKNNPIAVDEIGDFYRELFFYRLLMDYYVVRLRYGSSSSSHKLLCDKVDKTDYDEQAHAKLRQYQSMLDVSTEPHIWLLPYMKHLKSLKQEPTLMSLLKFLMLKDYQRNGHSEVPAEAHLDYDSKPRYWFWRLDYALWEKLILDKDAYTEYPGLDKEAIRQYEFRSNRSIEHLHPQNQNNNDEWDWKDVNSFGNLAMISSGFNSQQSNLPVHVKFANIEVQIGNKSLQSLKLYFMYLKAKGSEAEWDVTAKNTHAKQMLKILNDSLEIVNNYGQGESKREEL